MSTSRIARQRQLRGVKTLLCIALWNEERMPELLAVPRELLIAALDQQLKDNAGHAYCLELGLRHTQQQTEKLERLRPFWPAAS
jgi:hypothetical protein